MSAKGLRAYNHINLVLLNFNSQPRFHTVAAEFVIAAKLKSIWVPFFYDSFIANRTVFFLLIIFNLLGLVPNFLHQGNRDGFYQICLSRFGNKLYFYLFALNKFIYSFLVRVLR